MSALLRRIQAHGHLLASVLIGLVVVLFLPDEPWLKRLLIGWNTAVWLYLVQAFWIMSRADHHHLRRTAVAQAEGTFAVLTTVIVAAVASMTAIALELAGLKGMPASEALPHVAFALWTVSGAWLLLPTLFALSYASVYYRVPGGQGLLFPASSAKEPRDYWDFLYFAFTIAVASQTADVSVCSTSMRKLVLLQSVLSFLFNTAILALAINIAAGLI